jgi:hypothetical protein
VILGICRPRHGLVPRRGLFFSLALLLVLPSARAADPAATTPPTARAAKWIALAREKGLASRTEWLRLGHWEARKFGGYKSPAEGDFFFLSPEGRTAPEAELEATLQAFFSDTDYGPLVADEVQVPGRAQFQSPQCQFPARLMWLQRELGFPSSDLKPQDCRRFEGFRQALSAKSVTLVFSSYYLNNPSSAFGHSFLRLNKAAGARPGRGAELLDYGINYAAVVDTSNAIAYAFKGMAGFFPGTFTSIPYYYKIREYNDYEARDLWEYDLSLKPAQVDLLVAHLWELGSTYFRYYYLSTNCSYHVLGLIDAVDPSLNMLAQLPSIVIPGDTVKVLNEQPGLVTAVHYRPSVRTVFTRRLASLTPAEQDSLAAILAARDHDLEAHLRAFRASALPPESQVRILDIAADYIDLNYYGDLLTPEKKKASRAGSWKQALLNARSEMTVPSKDVEITPPWQEMPQAGHGSRRISLNGGYHARLGGYTSFNYRFALHDLADPLNGYPGYAQIEMGELKLRLNTREPSFWLDEILAFRILSLNPLGRFDKKLSWTVSLGGKRFYDGACEEATCFGAAFDVGGGFAVQPGNLSSLTVYALAMGEFTASTAFPVAHLRPGVGPTAGIRFHPTPELGFSLQSHYRYRLFTGPHDANWTDFTGRLAVRKSLAVEAKASHTLFSRTGEASLGLSYYY